MIELRRRLLAIPLAITLTLTACGGSFAGKMRLILAASPPLIEVLPLPPALKSGLITDFTDMADRTATLGECIGAADSKPAKLTCVQSFQSQVEAIVMRGNFGSANNQRLTSILGLIRGIIASARIYYGDASANRGAVPQRVTKDSLERQIKDLEEAMKP